MSSHFRVMDLTFPVLAFSKYGLLVKRTARRRALLAVVLILAPGCSIDLDERLEPCPASELVESVHSWGSMMTLRAAPGYGWHDLVREPFREYARPPITLQELERRYGPPLRSWEDEGRPFAEFAVPGGILRLGLEQEKSGSDVYRAWRLRWRSKSMELSQILEEPAVACVTGWLRPDVTVVLLDSESNTPRASIHFDDHEIREVTWPVPAPSPEAPGTTPPESIGHDAAGTATLSCITAHGETRCSSISMPEV